MSTKKKFSGQVTMSRAIKIFEALGFKTASKWNAIKLQKKLGKLHELVEGVELDPKNLKKVNQILRAQNEGKKIIVVDVDDVVAGKQREQDVKDAQKRAVTREQERKTKTVKKEKAMAKKNAKKKQAKKQAKKAVKAKDEKKKPGVIMSVLEFVKEQAPISERKILSLLKKRFPDKNVESMERTIPRVPNYLAREKGIDVIGKDDKGRLIIKK